MTSTKYLNIRIPQNFTFANETSATFTIFLLHSRLAHCQQSAQSFSSRNKKYKLRASCSIKFMYPSMVDEKKRKMNAESKHRYLHLIDSKSMIYSAGASRSGEIPSNESGYLCPFGSECFIKRAYCSLLMSSVSR